MKQKTMMIALIMSALFSTASLCADDAEDASNDDVMYLKMKPEIIANYGADSGHPKLLNADITLQLPDSDAAENVKKYMVPIRHDLIMLFSGLRSADADDGEKIESLRHQALASVQASLDKHVQGTKVGDLLFTKFVTE